MITVEEYIKLRKLHIDYSIEEFNIPYTGPRILSEFNRKGIKTFGALFDKLGEIIYFRQVGHKGKDIIYNTLFKYLQIENLMPNEKELKLYENRHPIDNPKLKIILETIQDLEKQKNELMNAEVEIHDLYKNLNSHGLEYLIQLPAANFELDSVNQTFISMCVERYLNNLTETMLNNKKSRFEIERTIQAKMDEYKAIVKAKREESKFKTDSSFIAKMATKIGEVRKYKRNTKTHKEEKEHNPFYNDGKTI